MEKTVHKGRCTNGRKCSKVAEMCHWWPRYLGTTV